MTNESATLDLRAILHLAMDPEQGAGEFLAVGRMQLVRKPLLHLELEEAFRRRMHRPTRAEILAVAARVYLPLPLLASARFHGPAPAAVYHFVGQTRGIIHEVTAAREFIGYGRGGALRPDRILGNVSTEMRQAVQSTFFSVREYVRAKLPHLTGDLLDYDYTYKVMKEDEPSFGQSAGLPTALAFLSVFTGHPLVFGDGLFLSSQLALSFAGDVALAARGG